MNFSGQNREKTKFIFKMLAVSYRKLRLRQNETAAHAEDLQALLMDVNCQIIKYYIILHNFRCYINILS